MSESLNLFWAFAVVVYLLLAALIVVSLYWLIRLGVRGALRDHHRWVAREATPRSGPNPSSAE